MSKRCDSCAVVEMLERDPRLRALPLAARMLWFALVREMQKAGSAVLRFGSVVPEPAETANLVCATEADLQSHIPVLLVRGLLEREEDGAFAAPFLRAALTRSEINRANGLKGGRPRKNPPGPQPAQREMLMPMPAAAAATTETEKPNAGSVSPSPAIARSNITDSSSLAAGRDEVQRIGRAAMAEAGLSGSTGHAGIVGKWLADGANETLILSTIRRKMERGAQPGHLGFFSKAIVEAMEAEQGSQAERDVIAERLTAKHQAWQRDFDAWQYSGPWNMRGPMPKPSDYAADGSRIEAAA